MAGASLFVACSSTETTSTRTRRSPKASSMRSPGFTSCEALATLPLTLTRPPSQASLATVRRLMRRETLRYLSRRMSSSYSPLRRLS